MLRRAIWGLAAWTSVAGATTLIVDGPGDGDGDGIDDHDTVAAALASLEGTLGVDGASDEIRVTVNWLPEPWGLGMNTTPMNQSPWQPLTDDLVLDGNGDADGSWCEWEIEGCDLRFHLADHQNLVLRRLKVYPGDPLTHRPRGFLNIAPADGAASPECSLTLEDVWLTGRDGLGHAADPWASSGHGLGDWEYPASPLSVDGFEAGSRFDLTARRVSIAHHEGDGMQLHFTDGSLAMEDVLVRRCRIRNPKEASLAYASGVFAQVEGTAGVQLDHVTLQENQVHGLYLMVTGQADLWMGPGCRFLRNGNDSFSLTRGAGFAVYASDGGQVTLRAEGTPAEPIVTNENGFGAGISATGPGSVLLRDVHAHFNRDRGLAITAAGGGKVAGLEHCLITDNAVCPTTWWDEFRYYHPSTNVVLGAPQSQLREATVSFLNCTIDDVHREAPETGRPLACDVELRGSNLRAEFTNCIIAGSDDEVALRLDPGASVHFDHSSVIIGGTDGVSAMRYDANGTITTAGLVSEDALFGVRNHQWDVYNRNYGMAGPLGGPLTGWGRYLGDVIQDAGMMWR